MKSIAIVNFKGGVGKTTITWLLAKYAAEKMGKHILTMDTDAQMSLTLAVQLQENSTMYGEFEDWYENQHRKDNKTILDAMKGYKKMKEGRLHFPVDSSFIYQVSSQLHFVPSVAQLYWFETGVFDKDTLKDFIKVLLGEIENTNAFHYDHVLFDCPAYFTPLAYSVLSSYDLILIPVNPDVFASRGVEIMIEGFLSRIKPTSSPEFAVFMNKARLYRDELTRETARWWSDIKYICEKKRQEGISIRAFESFIPEREDIKRSIVGRYFPDEFEGNFAKLWGEINKCLE